MILLLPCPSNRKFNITKTPKSSEILFTPIFYMDKVFSRNPKMINFGCAYCGWNGLIVCSYIYTFLSSRTLSLVNTLSWFIFKDGGAFFFVFTWQLRKHQSEARVGITWAFPWDFQTKLRRHLEKICHRLYKHLLPCGRTLIIHVYFILFIYISFFFFLKNVPPKYWCQCTNEI